MSRKGTETVSQFIRRAVLRAELYEGHLGEDITGKLVHHAERMAYHHHSYSGELSKLQKAAREVGVELPVLPSVDTTKAPPTGPPSRGRFIAG